jgi:hypothetical protein
MLARQVLYNLSHSKYFFNKEIKLLGTMAHTCHPSYLGRREWEDCGSKLMGVRG